MAAKTKCNNLITSYHSKGRGKIFFKEINTFIQQGGIKLLKLTVNTFIMQKISVSYKFFSFELSVHQRAIKIHFYQFPQKY